jgi:hypothetical protein
MVVRVAPGANRIFVEAGGDRAKRAESRAIGSAKKARLQTIHAIFAQ